MRNTSLLVLLFVLLLFVANLQWVNRYDGQPSQTYIKMEFHAPVLTGWVLGAFTSLTHLWPLNQMILAKLYVDSQFRLVPSFGQSLDITPVLFPLKYPTAKGTPLQVNLNSFNPTRVRQEGFAFTSALDFARAYSAQKVTPTEIVRKIVDEAIPQSNAMNPPLRSVISSLSQLALADAEASALRYKKGEPLSVLDGVPVTIKDEIDVKGYATYVGTSFLGEGGPKSDDACVVARLKKLGAIIVGKTNMYELGLGTTGANYHWGMPRNPYNTSHYTGGSSAGAASSVSSGLVPIAIGADGGGSVRIPAAFNGLVGIKATFGRISERGAYPLTHSNGHVGPMAGSVIDCAIGYLAIQGEDSHDRISLVQPYNDFQLSDLEESILPGLKIGVFDAWNRDSDPSVYQAVNGILAQLKSSGAVVKDIEIPYLSVMKLAHTMTIGQEICANVEKYLTNPKYASLFAYETRTALNFLQYMSYSDYHNALKIRAYFMDVIEKIFEDVDVIITPAAPTTAPYIKPESIDKGISDIKVTGSIMSFLQLGNFVGIPGIVVPISYDENSLPVSMQIMTKHWAEKVLFQVAYSVENLVHKKKPSVFFDILKVDSKK